MRDHPKLAPHRHSGDLQGRDRGHGPDPDHIRTADPGDRPHHRGAEHAHQPQNPPSHRPRLLRGLRDRLLPSPGLHDDARRLLPLGHRARDGGPHVPSPGGGARPPRQESKRRGVHHRWRSLLIPHRGTHHELRHQVRGMALRLPPLHAPRRRHRPRSDLAGDTLEDQHLGGNGYRQLPGRHQAGCD